MILRKSSWLELTQTTKLRTKCWSADAAMIVTSSQMEFNSYPGWFNTCLQRIIHCHLQNTKSTYTQICVSLVIVVCPRMDFIQSHNCCIQLINDSNALVTISKTTCPAATIALLVFSQLYVGSVINGLPLQCYFQSATCHTRIDTRLH